MKLASQMIYVLICNKIPMKSLAYENSVINIFLGVFISYKNGVHIDFNGHFH